MIFYGINPLLESLHSSSLPKRVLVQSGKDNPRIQKIVQLASEKKIVVERVNNLAKICDSPNHQGVAAEINGLGQLKLDEVSDIADRVLILDGIQDPHNFGASMRVCDAFGFRDIIYHRGNSCGITPAAIKVSTGALFHLRLLQSNLNSALKRMLSENYRVLALEAEGEVDIYDADYSGKICLVMGSEGKGIRFNIKRQATSLIRIPMAGNINSLNVSCALTAVLSEVARQSKLFHD